MNCFVSELICNREFEQLAMCVCGCFSHSLHLCAFLIKQLQCSARRATSLSVQNCAALQKCLTKRCTFSVLSCTVIKATPLRYNCLAMTKPIALEIFQTPLLSVGLCDCGGGLISITQNSLGMKTESEFC